MNYGNPILIAAIFSAVHSFRSYWNDLCLVHVWFPKILQSCSIHFLKQSVRLKQAPFKDGADTDYLECTVQSNAADMFVLKNGA